ncbi:MAG TPA: non-homologous end-joining DNA ligase [Verrucomicrobiae bacterium]|jgi:bifunctional non-homologous end joining protein LigD|nr:non-homologous end-joining DNA ligase [Verrucomicrobiae bacterium]
MSLKEYQAKRNFRRTSEPAGAAHKKTALKEPFFVIQKHDATRLHYDFRLEMDGVLKSWAVPKGFPTTHGDRRLAVQVEDHPLDYAQFEGTIPAGNYGAGTVMVWDIGSYEVSGDPLKSLESGKLHLTLRGKKLKGEWTLVRMRPREREDKPQWLLLKSGDDLPEISARADDQSVLTKRSMKKIAEENDAQWQSNRKAQPTIRQTTRELIVKTAARMPEAHLKQAEEEIKKSRLPKRKAAFVEPMKAILVENLPRGEDWIYELKFDGVRSLGMKRGKETQLVSRNAKDFNAKFPEIAEALKKLPCKEAMLDGEIVALDEHGRPSFQLLQARELSGERPPIFYYVFDLIQLDGKDLTAVPLLKRKAMAKMLLAQMPDAVRFSASIDADSHRVLKEMQARGLEGVIAKRKDSKYEIGRRSGAWVKFKWTTQQEFVIGGYSEPRGTRSNFGALVVGYYEDKKLKFAAKVGTGFDQKLLKSLHQKFQKLIRRDCPFVNLPEKAGRFGRGLTAAEMKRCTWLDPKLVCEIRFAEWTRDGHLRQPAFLGMREDKRPLEVVREKARPMTNNE